MMLSVDEAIRSAVVDVLLLRERWQSGVAYNPLSARTAQDPYPVYAALRARAPVHRSRLLNSWVFTRHADMAAILRDHRRFGNDPRKGTLSARQLAMLPPPHEYTMLILDPPDHTRLRALVSKAFTPRTVSALEPRIRGILAALLDAIEDPAAFDLMQAVARPLPIIVIAEMLGVPAEDRAQFRIWSAQRARLLETDDRSARTKSRRGGLASVRCLFPTDHRGASGRAARRYRERPGAGPGRRRTA